MSLIETSCINSSNCSTIVWLSLAVLTRATAEGSLPEIAQYSSYYLTLNVLVLPKDQTIIFYLLFKPIICFNNWTT